MARASSPFRSPIPNGLEALATGKPGVYKRLLDSLMRRSVLALVLPAAALLAGCVSNPYRPYRSGAGYSEAEVAPGVYEIAFEGTGTMGIGRATELAKVRAAEVTIDEGFRHFEILARDVGESVDVTRRPYYGGAGIGVGYGYRPGLGGGVGLRYGGLGGGYDIDTDPVAVLKVRLLEEPTADSFVAARVLREAIEDGIVPREALRPKG